MSIGGVMRYDVLAQLHRPTDSARLAIEVRRLAREQHLTAVDIATALRMHLTQVREILGTGDIHNHAGEQRR